MPKKRFVFVSYARQDANLVLPVVEAVSNEYRRRTLRVELWIDVKDLLPGVRWEPAIRKALVESVGLLIFVSPAAMRSDWTSKEIAAAAEHLDRLIIPVILEFPPHLPPALAKRQWIDLSGGRKKSDLRRAAKEIADATAAHLKVKASPPPVTPAKVSALAATIAQETRGVRRAEPGKKESPNSAFLVHVHNLVALSEMEVYLTDIGVETFVLVLFNLCCRSSLRRRQTLNLPLSFFPQMTSVRPEFNTTLTA